jgi:hypothetical protein
LRSHNSGHALFVALLVMVLVAASVALLAGHFGLRSRLVSQEARRIHLAALSDAAVAESIARLNESSGFAGIRHRPFGGGAIASQIESLSESRRLIVATADYRGWTRVTRVQVYLHPTSIEIESWSVQPPG